MTFLQIRNNREMDVVLEEFMVDEVEDIVSNLNELRSILIFAKDNLQTAEIEFQDLQVINIAMNDPNSISWLLMVFFPRDLICLASLWKQAGKGFFTATW